MNIWRGGDSTKGTRGAEFLHFAAGTSCAILFLAFYFLRSSVDLSCRFNFSHRHKEGTPGLFIFVDSPRKERLPLFPLFPLSKKERKKSLPR